MTQTHVLVLVVLAFIAHAAEEFFSGFYATDPAVHTLASLLSVAPIVAWVLMEVVLFVFLGALFVFRDNKVLWVILLLFMLAQLYHLFMAIYAHTYSGALSAILFVPLLWFGYQVSPFARFKPVLA